jgi:hypothetical protein
MKETIEQTMTCCKCGQPATEVGIGGMVCNDHAKTKHTPGPLDVCIGPAVTVGIAGKGAIAELLETPRFGGLYLDRETAIANARLFAAAPELLEALQMALVELEKTRQRLPKDIRKSFTDLNALENGAIKPARAAIAKATT